jgi:protein gp37
MARRLESMGAADYQPREVDGRTRRIAETHSGRAVFTGDVRMVPDKLTEPMGWKRPAMVFVNSMSDLFHESVPFDFVDQVWAVMALCPRHTFQVLTKRPERMAEYLNRRYMPGSVCDAAITVFDRSLHRERWPRHCDVADLVPAAWPFPNVWVGTSVENQRCADERIPHLVRCPAAVRFLSCEPLLDEVDLRSWLSGTEVNGVVFGRPVGTCVEWIPPIDWVIVGGESGPNARDCDVLWIDRVVEHCHAAGVPVFVKQLGARPMLGDVSDRYGWPTEGGPVDWQTGRIRLKDRKGADPGEWPEHLRVREMPEAMEVMPDPRSLIPIP